MAKCVEKGCNSVALQNSNYCGIHRPKPLSDPFKRIENNYEEGRILKHIAPDGIVRTDAGDKDK